LTTSVAAPARIWMKGHSTSGDAPATGCGALSEELSKKFDTLAGSQRLDEEAGGGAAPLGAGAVGVEALGPPKKLPLPPQPAVSKASPSGAAITA
jgi:hypothetical protein